MNWGFIIIFVLIKAFILRKKIIFSVLTWIQLLFLEFPLLKSSKKIQYSNSGEMRILNPKNHGFVVHCQFFLLLQIYFFFLCVKVVQSNRFSSYNQCFPQNFILKQLKRFSLWLQKTASLFQNEQQNAPQYLGLIRN